MTGVEHRRERRVPLFLPVTLHLPAGGKPVHGWVRNICRDGLYVESSARLPARGLVTAIPGATSGIALDGTALHCVITHSRRRGIGLEVLADTPEQSALMQALLRLASNAEGAAARVG